ncbi:hypothetical protein OG898_10045 [Streptomyces sp. NBC_00193]|uniref:ApeA N-terminal domain 1-containing protein n=1 Tax=Streptomyces sp. NBC_00193 TaxID=2975675 RepID=UPI00225C3C56|nr:HEPN domain-containing protein [Streptomyces sp. NBC_00193]MCX5296830.1 hypothetical protein [Streptomyces sp. NBC_00193]
MAQDKSSDVISDWWVPEDGPEATTPGTYSVLESGNALVRLHRPIGGESDFFSNTPARHPVIHGNVFGKSVTLVNARVNKWRLGGGNQADIEMHPQLALEGLLLSQDELRLTEAKVRIQGQDDWIAEPRLTQEFHPDGSLSRINMPSFTERVAWAQNGCITIKDFSLWRYSNTEASIKGKTGFHFLFEEPISLKDFFDNQLRGLQMLMTMVTGNRCGIESLRFTDSTWEIDGETPPEPHWVTARLRAPERNTTGHRQEILFPFEEFDWEAQAHRIFDLSTAWTYTTEQWALLLDSRFVWPVARFATAASAVEALDRILHPDGPYVPDPELISRVKEELSKTELKSRDRAKLISGLRPRETSLAQRIARLASFTPEAMGELIDQPVWADRVAKLRHVVSHGLESSEDFSHDTRSVQCASEILLHLLECTFLYHLGFTPDQIKQLKTQHPATWQRRQIISECFDLLPPSTG